MMKTPDNSREVYLKYPRIQDIFEIQNQHINFFVKINKHRNW